MINLPITDDRLDLRIAGEWTKRNGYTFNETTGEHVDGRDLWSGRVTLGMKPTERLQAYLTWEHFSEDDDRERSTKQLCDYDAGPTQVGPFNQSFTAVGHGRRPHIDCPGRRHADRSFPGGESRDQPGLSSRIALCAGVLSDA